MIIKLVTKCDKYCNPRILFVLTNEHGKFLEAWDGGYSDYCSVPLEYQEDAKKAVCIPTTPQFYKDIKKFFCK